MSQVKGPICVQHIDTVWPAIRDGLQRSCLRSGGDLDTADLWVECRNGTAFLIVVTDGEEGEEHICAASIWRPETWQTGKKLRCLALYGNDMRAWIYDMRALVADIAKGCGANALVSDGRPGWQAIFPEAKVLRLVYEEKL